MNILASMRYLVALNEHRHFGRAALASHITQPALSNALRALEREFGVLIVHRGRSFAGFTAEGEAVLATAQRMLREQERLRERLAGEAAQPGGRLRLAAVPTAMPLLLDFAVALQARHPAIAPTVVSLSSLEIETALEAMAVDMALGYTGRTRVRNARLRSWPQGVERYFLVRRATASRSTGKEVLRFGTPIGWAEAAEHPLCLLTADMHNRSIVDQAFQQSGHVVAPVLETNTIHTLASSVAAGNFAGVLPEAALDLLQGGRFEARPLVLPTVEAPLGFLAVEGERMSRALEAAVALAQDAGWLAQVQVRLRRAG